MAQLEHEILRQNSIEGKDDEDRITSKVSVTSPSLKHHLAPSPNAFNEFESRGNHLSRCTDEKSGGTMGYVS